MRQPLQRFGQGAGLDDAAHVAGGDAGFPAALAVRAYWQVGRLIVEHEQGGAKRAAYGEAVLEAVSKRLMGEFGRGFDVTNLRKMPQFYRVFEIRDALGLESADMKRDAPRLASTRRRCRRRNR